MSKIPPGGNVAKKLSRREFLEAGMVASIATRVPGYFRPRPLADEESPSDESLVRRMFKASERVLLALVADEIIPASDDMPAASQVGCVDYLERMASRNPEVAKNLRRTLIFLGGASQKRFQTPFRDLSRDQKVQVLREMEWRCVDLFKAFRDSVYEAYYEQPEVWRIIGYRFYATDGAGPAPMPFDPQILAEVRKRPSYYRAI